MANITFVSTHLPAIAAEAARRLFIAERALLVPINNVAIDFADSLVTISGTLPNAQSVDTATGNIVTAFSDYTPDADPVLTGTALAAVTASSLSEVLAAAVVQQDNALQVKIDAAATLPAGVSSTYSFGDGGFTFTVVLPVAYSIDASGNQVATVSNYLV